MIWTQLFKSKNQVVYFVMWIPFVLARVPFSQRTDNSLGNIALLHKDLAWVRGVYAVEMSVYQSPTRKWGWVQVGAFPTLEKIGSELPAKFSLGLCSRFFSMTKNYLAPNVNSAVKPWYRWNTRPRKVKQCGRGPHSDSILHLCREHEELGYFLQYNFTYALQLGLFYFILSQDWGAFINDSQLSSCLIQDECIVFQNVFSHCGSARVLS